MVWILPDLMAPSTQRVLWLCGLIRVHQPWWFDRWHTDADVPLQICKLMFCPPPPQPPPPLSSKPCPQSVCWSFSTSYFYASLAPALSDKTTPWMLDDLYVVGQHCSGLVFDEQTWCSCRELVTLKFSRAMFLLTLFLTVMVHRFWSGCARGLPFGYPTITLNYFLSASLFTGFMHPTTCTFISLLRSKNIW